MDIVPILTKDNLSKEQIEYLQKQQTEYKLVNKIKRTQDISYSLLIEKQGKSRELLLYTRLLLV